ncbi:tetratricopeptide repeat protein [Pontixanthobacter luteolus]|uniref:tetratricopeptide repeat protein n=1 Tax=Pontixanthobacter luteolus TaxID=295089 RepID=UPI0023027A53|nr:hypothetical protein [Pontixanthobacter luteolus]
MKTSSFKLIACIAIASSLSGCQSFLSSLNFGERGQAQARQSGIFGEIELAEGRKALSAGNVTTAIDQFRLAAINDATRGDALNGLGVAYAKLGRGDLAERYFMQALEWQPSNPRYLANLEKFYTSSPGKSLLERRASKEAAVKVAKAAQLPVRALPNRRAREVFIRTGTAGPSQALAASSAPHLVRSNRNEIFIASQSGSAANRAPQAMKITSRNSAPKSDSEGPAGLPKIAVKSEKADQQYPIRVNIPDGEVIEQPEEAPTKPVPARKTIYPVRINMTKLK